jgi:hypothetical protein
MIKLIKHAVAGLLILAGTAAARNMTPIGQTVTRAGTGPAYWLGRRQTSQGRPPSGDLSTQ